MTESRFLEDLKTYGPRAVIEKPPTLRQARRYCRRLARRHYENFTVASFLLPRRLRKHFYNIYAYCRWADDLADEIADPRMSLMLLDWWKGLVKQCFEGQAVHPVFVALADTVKKFSIPPDPFLNLLVAFRQDQRQQRYETIDDLLQYCRYSANPVGRLVLYLDECFSDERARLADSICTGLQLANFCQDVALDYARGRIYLPQVECRRHGYDETMFAAGQCNPAFRRLLAAEVDRAEGFLRAGMPLVGKVPSELRLDVSLFIHGGLAVLDAIRQQDYDVWSRRPTVGRIRKLRLALRCWWRPDLQPVAVGSAEP